MKSKSKILIVDDEPNNIKIISKYLAQYAYQLAIAKNGKEAIEICEEFEPDLILLDIMMPVINGFETCKLLKSKEKTKEIPIIFLTARADPESIVTGLEIGGADYLVKPFERTELLARIETQLKLHHTVAELRAANLAKDKFFNIIAHDLKGPISGMVGLTDLLEDGFGELDTKTMEEVIQNLSRSSKSSLALLNHHLEWAQTQINRIEPIRTDIKIQEILDECFPVIREFANIKKIDVHIEIDPFHEIFADFKMISTAIRNILHNAIKFTPIGGTVWVESEINQQQTRIKIRDNGIGMSGEDVERLFRIDVQTTKRGTENEKGTGLGLLLSEEFVKTNGGGLEVVSQLGKGSCFTITLPRFPMD